MLRIETPFQKISDACRTTGLSQYFLRRGIRNGTIPHVTVGAPPNCKYYVNVPALLKQLGVPFQFEGDGSVQQHG